MEIKLETLQHQLDALEAIDKAFPGMDRTSSDPNSEYIYANPLINYRYKDKANIDIKMETGTGKTYVYTRMMYEMHQKYGLFKFIIAVPNPSIKEGTRSFIGSNYAKQHFGEFYENTRIHLNVINAGDFSSHLGRRNFPAQLSHFVESTRQNKNQIEVLLINQGMLHSKSMHRSDYDQTLLGGETCPIEAIASTRPVVIIDEPQRFPRGKKFYQDIECIKPQLIVRFGATFPEVTKENGTSKVSKIDYYRGEPQFDLNAIDSFNRGLVKGVDINYPDISEAQANNLYKVKQAKAKELILTNSGKEYSVVVGENLADVDAGFEGSITYEGGINRELSNGLTLSKDMKLIPGTFAENYQDEIISQALDCHFKNERDNFMRVGAEDDAPKIKTLSLFFIDSISSFRDDNNKKGWLAKDFEKLLGEKLSYWIEFYKGSKDVREQEYRDFLLATLRSLKSEHQNVYAGYFSEDRVNSDDDIQAEVTDILTSKEKLLGFKDDKGEWVTRRFLFSKWTLREGWDNPNVFVIAKLRTSGSEISKIQEVGRGLRLPVDETGHRLKQDECVSRLSLLVGYDERDFAERLIGEINTDTPIKINHNELTNNMISFVVKIKKESNPSFNAEQLVNSLGEKGIIDFSHKFKPEVIIDDKKMSGYEAFLQLVPEILQKVRVSKGKIRNLKESKDNSKVRLCKSNWEQLKELWTQLSNRKMIKFDTSVNKIAEMVAEEVFKDNTGSIFVLEQPQLVHQEVDTSSNHALIHETKSDYKVRYLTMKYGHFLKQLAQGTDLPVSLLNSLMINAMKPLRDNTDYINEKTLGNLIKTFNQRFNKKIRAAYSYISLDFSSSTSIYNEKKGGFVDEVSANLLGIYASDSTKDSKYLYDRPPLRYDSVDPELEILKRTYSDKVVVFGKLPKQAIKIPRYDNGTTTPDFIFKIEQNNETVYVIIETKANNMRLGDEDIKIIQQKYFDQLKSSGVYYRMATSEDEVHQLISKIENGNLTRDDISSSVKNSPKG